MNREVELLKEKHIQREIQALIHAIKDEWGKAKIPLEDEEIGVWGIDASVNAKLIKGKRFDALDFDRSEFFSEAVMSQMGNRGIAYYLAGYMINALTVASNAEKTNGVGWICR